MSPSGFLTSIDFSIRHTLNPKGPDRRPVFVSVDQVNRALNFIKQEEEKLEKQKGPYLTLFEYVHPLALGAIDRYSSGSELIAYKMMNMHPGDFQSEENIARIAKYLVVGYPAHSFPILYDEAKKIGLPVEKVASEVADMLRSLVKTYNVATMPTSTHLSSTYYRFESMPVVIESLGMRTSYRYMYFKRVNPATKNWQIEDNNSQWVNIYPPKEGEKLAKMVPIDAPFPQQPVQHDQENHVEPVLIGDDVNPYGRVLQSVSCISPDGNTRGYLRNISLPSNFRPNWRQSNPGDWSGPYYDNNLEFSDGTYCNRVEGRGATLIEPR